MTANTKTSAAVLLACALLGARSLAQERKVSVYVSLDFEYAEEIGRQFEKKTGIKVGWTADAEANKTVYLSKKIIEEAPAPKCDVFWNNECGQTLRLAEKGLLERYVSPSAATIPAVYKDAAGAWTGFAARARIIAWNPKLAKAAEVPTRVADFADPRFRSRGVIAKPVTGTTLTHVCALYGAQGKDKTDAWLDRLVENDVRFAPGNGPAMREVAEGARPFCLTDTDDAHAASVQGHPVEVVYPDQGAEDPGVLLIPNTVMMIKGAPHPEEAKAFIDYVLSPEVEELLAKGRSAQIPLHPGVPRPPHVRGADQLKVMSVDWAVVGRMIENHFDGLVRRFESAPTTAVAAAEEAKDRTATWILAALVAVTVILIAARARRARRAGAGG